MDNDRPQPHPQQQQPRKTIQVWLCDVCSQQFRDFDEACRHEENCRQEKEEGNMNSAETPEPESDKPPANPSSEFKIESNSMNSSSAEKTSPEESNLSSSQAESASKPIVSPKPESSLTVAAVGRPKRRAASRPSKFKDGIDTSLEAHQADEPKKKKRQLKQARIQPLANNKKTKPVSKTAKKAPIASIFARPEEQKAALAEHRAAEFMAKRRADAQRERERQQRRLQAKQQLEETTSKPAEDKKKPEAVENARLPPAAVRFPAMSHVGVEASGWDSPSSKDGTAWVRPEDLDIAQVKLVHNARYPTGEPTLESNDFPRLLQSQNDTLRDVTESDPLQTMLSSLLSPPKTRLSSDSPAMSLWCDKYGIQKVPEDVCGEDNKKVAEQMLNFVEDWKVERRKAHDRRAEKQKALLKSKKRKRKTAYAEDLWEDSDDDEFGLCNVCLITGPSGSGKTTLVHAVAKQSDCLVLEINTAEKRSGAALKHAIEEATQSDSSLDMLKKTGSLQDATDLVDSDDDMEESELGSAVVVILIDEVDNVYEEEGDNGFWAALNTVAKRAKCPIFLTANSAPSNLRSIRYRSLEVSRPSAVECTSHIWRIVEGEGFSLRRDWSDDIKTRLADVAKLCGCDLRHITNELQLFSSSGTTNSNTSRQDEFAASDQVPEKSLPVAPFIASVYPKAVRPNEVTLLMIKGEHFLRLAEEDLSCEVLVGDQPCPLVQIMDDFTIFAACPPCTLPSNVSDSCLYIDTYRQCYTSRYAPLTVRAKTRSGILSTTEGTVRSGKLFTGEIVSYSAPPINVEYGFAPPRYDLMYTLQDPDPSRNPGNVGQVPRIPTDVVDRHAEALMKDAVARWRSSLPLGIPTSPLTVASRSKSERDSTGKAMEGLASHHAQLSDAALLDDSFSQGALPHLAGSVPGFRSDLVDDTSATQSDQAKKKANTHTFERLHELGWNDNYYFFGDADSFMTLPLTSRERRLLARDESHGRGDRQAVSNVAAPTAAYDDEQLVPGQEDSGLESLNVTDKTSFYEDMLLPGFIPPCMVGLPSLLRQSLSPRDQLRLALLPEAVRDELESRWQLLSQIVLQDENRRLVSPSAARILMDLESPVQESASHLLIDYFPFLSVMADFERASEWAYQQALASNPETAALAQGQQRSTRRTKKLVRPHHFTTGGLHDDDSVVHDFGDALADSLLRFRWP